MNSAKKRDLDLDLFFLGSKSEQRQFLLETVQLILNDHIFWRRNYHPKDPPPIPYPVVEGEDARHYRELFFSELFSLISDLKLDVPFFSPRYMAHMVSESTLPSLVAYMATLLYNPNNVSSEASPVTIRYELEVGKQFAELFGFSSDRSFGHVASGGTIANYESIWFNRAGRYLPLSLSMARRHVGLSNEELSPTLFWERMNMPLNNVEDDFRDFVSMAADTHEKALDLLKPYLHMYAGDRPFTKLVENAFGIEWTDPVLIAPSSAHYSWSRAVALFGIGKSNMIKLDVDSDFRVCPDSFRATLDKCLSERTPIIQTVLVAGTTEFGAVDPIDDLAEIRDEYSSKGLYSPIHVDAAYGGYFATMFRPGERHDVTSESTIFGNTPWLKKELTGISRCDSVTVDPHKAGYIPYGAGCIVLKHGFLKDIVSESAPYLLDSGDKTNSDDVSPQLGRFIMEGSKPGAAAAATWFSHRLIPLNMDGYGRHLTALCQIARRFESLLRKKMIASSKNITLIPVNSPNLNILCLFALPDDAESLAEVNALNLALADRFGIRDVQSIQSYDYLISHTVVSTNSPYVQFQNDLTRLSKNSDVVDVLRLVFMNRWVEKNETSGHSYLESFYRTLLSEANTLWEKMRIEPFEVKNTH